MTPDEFANLLKPSLVNFVFTPKDGMRLAEAVAGLDESERKKLVKVARDFWRKVNKSSLGSNHDEFATLAMLAVCPLSDARKAYVAYFQRQEDAVLKVLNDRRPEWIDEWVAHHLEIGRPLISWKLLYGLIRAGACRKPQSRGYAEVLTWGVVADNQMEPSQICEQLLTQPDLIDDVWRFFEHDIAVFHEGSKLTAVVALLAEQGVLDRQRLLDESLQTLFHDIKEDVRSQFARFYRSLKPTHAEQAARQRVFLELLSHRASAMATFALEELAELETENLLDREAFLSAGKSVFVLKPKGQSLTALRLAAGAAKERPELVPAAIGFVLEGLSHDSPDVQKQALKLLKGWQQRLHSDHWIEIRARLPALAATARKEAEALLAGAPSPHASSTSTSSPVATDVQVADGGEDWPSRAATLSEKWRRLAGVDAALAALARNELPSPVEFCVLDVPVLNGVQAIAPIESVDELLDAVAHAIEVIETGDEIERILDGISRLCDQRPANFALRAAPLVARMNAPPKEELLHGLRNQFDTPALVRQLIVAWLSGHRVEIAGVKKEEQIGPHFDHLRCFINERAKEIERRMLQQQAAPLLAAPTHQFGWLEPCAFVRRLNEVAAQGDVPKFDLVQAILRLAPENRACALGDASTLTGEVGRAVRWALGGGEGPSARDKASAEIWLAAARARDPFGELVDLAPLFDAQHEAFALAPPQFEWRAVSNKEHSRWRPGGAVAIKITSTAGDMRSPHLRLWPTVALCELANADMGGCTDSWHTQWLTAMWPANGEARFAVGARVLCNRVNSPASTYEPNYSYLLPLLEPDRSWTEMACVASWIALVSKDSSSRSMAVDCLIRAIDDGRAPSKRMADVLSRLLGGEWVKLNRVAESLAEVARCSPLHAWWTVDFLQQFLLVIEQLSADVHHLLSLLVEQVVELGLALSAPAKERLAAVKLGGKSVKLAQQLLNLETTENAKLRTAMEQVLAARLARAERWQAAGQQ